MYLLKSSRCADRLVEKYQRKRTMLCVFGQKKGFVCVWKQLFPYFVARFQSRSDLEQQYTHAKHFFSPPSQYNYISFGIDGLNNFPTVANFRHKLWETRSQLYRSQILQPNTDFSRIFRDLQNSKSFAPLQSKNIANIWENHHRKVRRKVKN